MFILFKLYAAILRSRHQYAEKLHNRILNNADMAASYFYELCKDIKRMRDEQLFIELGLDTFDDYIEAEVHIKQRQAYKYIAVYENLGDTSLRANAHLGIEKLTLLLELPAADHPGFAEDNCIDKNLAP